MFAAVLTATLFMLSAATGGSAADLCTASLPPLVLSAVKAGSTFFSSSKSVRAWCYKTILIANNYTPGSSKGNICVLHTPKSNRKHSVSMETTPPTVNKTIIIAHRLQLFLEMQIVNTK